MEVSFRYFRGLTISEKLVCTHVIDQHHRPDKKSSSVNEMRPSRTAEELKLKEAPNLVALPEKSTAPFSRFMLAGLIFFLITPIISLTICPDFFSSQTTTWFPTAATTTNVTNPTNISHILFGLGSSVATWQKRSSLAETWWEPNVTRGYVWLDANPNDNNNNVTDVIPFKVSSDWTRFRYTHSQSEVRIGRIVVDSFNLRLPDVRWFVMGDDDTVFFPENLAAVLSRYDHNEMYYVGGNSESVEQDVMHAYDMAFGGGGFAVSYALAARLAEMMDGCLDRYYNMYGSDQRVWACVSEIGVPLTKLSGFHQFDIRGDPYGVLAAHPLAPLLSLHHIDALKPIFPDRTHFYSVNSLLHAYSFDPPRLLHQSVCYDRRRKWTLSISWGYTIQLYTSMVSILDLKTPLRTFKTWRSWNDGPFAFNMREVSGDPCGKPIRYFLEHVQDGGKSGDTMTTYKRFDGDEEKKCLTKDYAYAMKLEKIVVLTKKMDPHYWAKEHAPRRQCSEIINSGSLWGGRTMLIRMRRCKPSESITIQTRSS